MAQLLLQNLTGYKLSIPRTNITLQPHLSEIFTTDEVDTFYNDPKIHEMMVATSSRGPLLQVTLLSDYTPGGAAGDAVLQFLTTAELPTASAYPGMMVFNTTVNNIQFSNGTEWLTIVILPVPAFTPNPATLPNGYAIWDAGSQSLLVANGGVFYRTVASGVKSYPSHIIPIASSVIEGTIVFDSDNNVLRVSDGSHWHTAVAVEEHSVHSLPIVTDYPFGYMIYVSDEYSLRVRSGINWQPIGGRLRYFAISGDLPGAPQFNTDQRGVAVYVDEDRSIRMWDGTRWIYPSLIPTYPTVSLPSAADYKDGYSVFDTTLSTIMVDLSGKWEHPAPVAPHYAATARPKPGDVPYGYMVFNTTSGKPNWSDGVNWVDGVGTIDP